MGPGAKIGLGLGAALVAGCFYLAWPALPWVLKGGLHKTYYIPSESNEPTLMPEDRVMPQPVAPADLRRGMVVVYRNGGLVWVSRIAGLPGDRIAMQGGVVWLNGVAVAQKPDGAGPKSLRGQASRFRERFPGEAAPHRILDSEASMLDEFPETRVRAGRVFLLSDNRDRAVDSRIDPSRPIFGDVSGPGMVPFADILGEVKFILYSSSRHRVGRAIDDLGPDD